MIIFIVYPVVWLFTSTIHCYTSFLRIYKWKRIYAEHPRNHVLINYDAGNKIMMFSLQEYDMVLTNVQMVDNIYIIYIGERYSISFIKSSFDRRIIDKDTHKV